MHTVPSPFLKGSTGQTAREGYQWMGLSKDTPRYSFLIFKFFILNFLEEFKFYSGSGPNLSTVITSSFGGRQA
jgi:hypothetical protein